MRHRLIKLGIGGQTLKLLLLRSFLSPLRTLLRRKASLRQEAIGRLLPIPTLLPPGKVGQATLPSSEPSTSFFLLWSARCWPSPL